MRLIHIAILLVFSNSIVSAQTKKNTNKKSPPIDGVIFNCPAESHPKIKSEVISYLNDIQIKPEWYRVFNQKDQLVFQLKTPATDTDTLNLYHRPEYEITEEVVELIPGNNPEKLRQKSVITVSKKEIVLALLQHGRKTELSGIHCKASSFIDHVGVRQNIVAWAEKVAFEWPDGGPAKWNEKYWKKGTPVQGAPRTHVIINDMFYNSDLYSIGCYTATKMVFIQGVLDYYHRIKNDESTLLAIEKILTADGEPLVSIEPAKMWSFEKDFDQSTLEVPGKLLRIDYGYPSRNFVPGDWIYLLNTDPATSDKTGYEGSNAVYLGRNKLDDYYADHNHYYYFEEKMDEVFQWRNGVFSRSNHASKVKPMPFAAFKKLFNTPENGGILMNLRTKPAFYNETGVW